jgi:signal transduction histidine kinase
LTINLLKLWQWLVKPHPSIVDREQRRKARLLSTLLLFSGGGTLIGGLLFPMASSVSFAHAYLYNVVILACLGLNLIIYRLSRSQHTFLAIMITVSLNILALFATIITLPQATILLSFLILGPILCSLLLPPSAILHATAVISAGVLLLPLIGTQWSWEQVHNTLFFVIIMALFAFISASMHQRNLGDIERHQKKIERLNIGLEDLVAERTAELVIALEHTKTAEKARSTLLDTMSHELRTPLNSVIGFSELLLAGRQGTLSEKQIRYADNINQSGKNLLKMVDTVLQTADLISEKVDFSPQLINIPEILQAAIQGFSNVAEEKEIILKANISETVGNMLADENCLRIILEHLLSNALKFTPQNGSVTLMAQSITQIADLPDHAPEAAPSSGLLIAVQDSGIGIATANLKKLFTALEQLDSSLHRQHEGAGLGLALTHKLVELHGGQIWAQSEGEGKGSTFAFVLPVDMATES